MGLFRIEGYRTAQTAHCALHLLPAPDTWKYKTYFSFTGNIGFKTVALINTIMAGILPNWTVLNRQTWHKPRFEYCRDDDEKDDGDDDDDDDTDDTFRRSWRITRGSGFAFGLGENYLQFAKYWICSSILVVGKVGEDFVKWFPAKYLNLSDFWYYGDIWNYRPGLKLGGASISSPNFLWIPSQCRWISRKSFHSLATACQLHGFLIQRNIWSATMRRRLISDWLRK